MTETCDESYGCGGPMPSSFSFAKRDGDRPDADADGFITVRVCRDCASTLEDDD